MRTGRMRKQGRMYFGAKKKNKGKYAITHPCYTLDFIRVPCVPGAVYQDRSAYSDYITLIMLYRGFCICVAYFFLS